MAAFEVLALDPTTPQIRAPGASDTYSFPRAITPSGANVTPFTLSGYSLTGANAQSMFDLSGTWNTTGTPTGIKFNITDTASNANSLLLDLQTGGTSRFQITKAGALWVNVGTRTTGFSSDGRDVTVNSGTLRFGYNYANGWEFSGGTVTGPSFNTNGTFALGSSQNPGLADVIIARDAANTLAQRNSTNAQTFNIYNTFTDASNYERGRVAWATNVLTIGTEKLGTGTARALEFQTDGTTRISIAAAGTITLSATLQTSGTTSFNGWSAFGGNSGEGLAFGSTSGIRWASSTSTGVFTSGDTGISRKAAKIVEINSGTTGTYAGTAFTTGSQTVAQLPAAATAGAGARAFVTDATATTFLSTVAGGGANAVPVVSNGTNWLIG